MTISKADESLDITKILEELPSSNPGDEFDFDAFLRSWGNETENRELEEKNSISPAIERDTPTIDSGDRAVRDLILLVDTSGSMEDFKRVEVGCLL